MIKKKKKTRSRIISRWSWGCLGNTIMSSLCRPFASFCSATLNFSPSCYHLMAPRWLLQCQSPQPHSVTASGQFLKKESLLMTLHMTYFLSPGIKLFLELLGRPSSGLLIGIESLDTLWHQGRQRNHLSGSCRVCS